MFLFLWSVFLCSFSTKNQSLIIQCILITHKQELLLKIFCTSEKKHKITLLCVFLFNQREKETIFLIFCCQSWIVLNFSLFLRLGIRTVQISNVFYITKRLIPYIHPHTWWKTCFDRESIGQFGTSLQIERFEKFKAGCKRILLSFGESLFKVWTIHIIGIIMSLLLTYQNNLHN